MTTIKLLIAIIVSALLAQIIDFTITAFKTKQINFTRIWQTGGFPSSHTAGVTTLALGIFLLEGLSTSFIISLSLALIVIRDAIGVRKEVGKHSIFLNKKYNTNFNEKAGHNLLEVIGGIILGVVIALLFLL